MMVVHKFTDSLCGVSFAAANRSALYASFVYLWYHVESTWSGLFDVEILVGIWINEVFIKHLVHY